MLQNLLSQNSLHALCPTLVFLHREPAVPVKMKDGLCLRKLRKTLPRHKGKTQQHAGNTCADKHAGPRPVLQPPFHPAVVPAMQRPLDGDPPQQRMRPECRHFPVPPPVKHGNHRNGDDVRSKKDYGHGHGLVIKERTGNAAYEYQRHKHRAGGEYRTEHGSHDFPRAFQDGGTQIAVPLPTGGDVVDENNGVVGHHAHA